MPYIKSYIKYFFSARHKHGHSIHSPFVYDFIINILNNKIITEEFLYLQKHIKTLHTKTNTFLKVEDFGTGQNRKRSIKDIAIKSSISNKYAKLLFNTVKHYKPENILELGTSIGISSALMAFANKNSQILTIEACKNTAQFAAQFHQSLFIKNIIIENKNLDNQLDKIVEKYNTLDFVYFDANHQYTTTLNYFNTCLKKTNNNSIFILDDIRWSKEMFRAWTDIIKMPQISVSIDLGRLGILFFRQENSKEHFIIKY